MFKEQFRRAYLDSLSHYRHFYDDFSEYGNPDEAQYAFYFIPGINGTPGQVRFALPSLLKRFGRKLYLRGCYLPEFSATSPVWEKYSPHSVTRKREQVARDLAEMTERFASVYVIASSNGFYDFLRAVGELSSEARSRLCLLWIACAPDRFEISPWVEFFHRWTGFDHEGCRWAAVPNHNWLVFMNPETNIELEWRHGSQRRLYFKEDIESRFRCLGVRWVYTSPECFNRALESAVVGHRGPLGVEAHVLAASKDGYWYGRPPGAMTDTLDKYLTGYRLLLRPASHLWVVTPDHLTEYLSTIPDRKTAG